MEMWRRDREDEKRTILPMSKKSSDSFHGFQPDMAALEKHETKIQTFVERAEQKANAIDIEPVINVMGSTAGAGSGDFHTFRGYRTKELARLKDFEDEREEDQKQREWESERDGRLAGLEAKSNKRAAKRQKAKQNKKSNASSAKDSGAADAAASASALPAGSKRPAPEE